MIKSIFYVAIASMLFTGCVGTDSDYTLKVEKPQNVKTAGAISPSTKSHHQ